MKIYSQKINKLEDTTLIFVKALKTLKTEYAENFI